MLLGFPSLSSLPSVFLVFPRSKVFLVCRQSYQVFVKSPVANLPAHVLDDCRLPLGSPPMLFSFLYLSSVLYKVFFWFPYAFGFPTPCPERSQVFLGFPHALGFPFFVIGAPRLPLGLLALLGFLSLSSTHSGFH